MTSCKLSYPVQKCLSILNENGFEAYLVGGAVRDFLHGEPIHDYDITTSALPNQIQQAFSSYPTIPTGIKHGTITVILDDQPIEITTYRTEQAYLDHRHPSQVHFTTSLEEDCARRDFTINALCFHPEEGVIDFFHGEDDLHNHIIRAIGDPNKRMEEDALRILRAIRFSSTLHFEIEPSTKQALFTQKELLSSISIERIREEFHQILLSDDPYLILLEYQEIFTVFLPELHSYTKKDWQTIQNRLSLSSPSLELRYFILLEPLSDPLTPLKRLKLSNAQIQAFKNLVELKDMPISTAIEQKRLLQRCKVPFEVLGSLLTVYHGVTPELLETLQHLFETECLSLKQLQVSGQDLLDLGIPSQQIGNVLNQLLEEVVEERLPNDKDILLSWLTSHSHF